MIWINQLRLVSAQLRVAQRHHFRRHRSQLPANRSRGIVVAHEDKYSTNASTPGWPVSQERNLSPIPPHGC